MVLDVMPPIAAAVHATALIWILWRLRREGAAP
jgi:hypothetical protein